MHSAFQFTGLVAQYYQGHYVDACSNLILYGGDQDALRKVFEAELLSQKSGDHEAPNRIEKVVAAPVLDQLLTEAGPVPINWPDLAAEARRVLEATPLDCEDQGYWVDCEQVVRPESLAPDLASLQRDLPEECQSGLNWAAEKTYFFLVTVLSPLALPGEQVEEIEEPMRTEEKQELEEEALEGFPGSGFDERLLAWPQLAAKDLAVVVRARNSVVAAWLWRRHSTATPQAGNAIRLDILCEIAPLEGKPE